MNVLGVALSGMQVAEAQIAAAAQNTVNAETPGYGASRVDQAAISTSAIAVGQASASSQDGGDGARRSNVNLASEMVHITRAQLLYSANAALLKIGKKTTGNLLDILDHQRPLPRPR